MYIRFNTSPLDFYERKVSIDLNSIILFILDCIFILKIFLTSDSLYYNKNNTHTNSSATYIYFTYEYEWLIVYIFFMFYYEEN